MESLPTEILSLILRWKVRMYRTDKNNLLPLRLVCKAFDSILKPYALKTVQLEFSRFLRDGPTLDRSALERMGSNCEAAYLDLMVVRDEEEINRLKDIFGSLIPKVPEMTPLLDTLAQYQMTESTFDEVDFKRILEDVLAVTPNIMRFKLNLPFQIVGPHSHTATMLLATTFECLAKRPEDSKAIETLVLDHVSDTSVLDISKNHMDVGYGVQVFSGLKNLVLSIKRQESHPGKQALFTKHLWFFIRKAEDLSSLCLIGWNSKRNISTRRHAHLVSSNIWNMRSLPLPNPLSNFQSVMLDVNQDWKCLRYLELKRVDIFPRHLINFITAAATTLKELYFNDAYLKVCTSDPAGNDQSSKELWIGLPDVNKPVNSCWVADEIRLIKGLSLNIIRATGLGYDDFQQAGRNTPTFDLEDPSKLERSFDERFVETIVLGAVIPGSPFDLYTPPVTHLPSDPLLLPEISHSPGFDILQNNISGPRDFPSPTRRPSSSSTINPWHKQSKFDAYTFQQMHNTTSQFKRCIDGVFYNHNEEALKKLQGIISVADRAMTLLSEEIERSVGRNGDMAVGATGAASATEDGTS